MEREWDEAARLFITYLEQSGRTVYPSVDRMAVHHSWWGWWRAVLGAAPECWSSDHQSCAGSGSGPAAGGHFEASTL